MAPPAATEANPVWQRNARLLAAHATAASANAVCGDGAMASRWRLRVEPDRTGNLQFRPLGADGAGSPLHSPRDPQGEAQRQVERWLEGNPLAPGRIVVVFGLGAGFHLQALAERLDETNGLLVVDVNPGVVADALPHADLAALEACRAKTLRFVVGDDAERVFAEFYDVLSQWPRLDYSFFIHPGTQRAFADVYSPMAHRFAEKVRVDMIQRCTVMNLTRQWLENAIRNLPNLIDSTPLSALRNGFGDTPAAVVAAGPTLTQSLDLLRELRDRMLIIAVGTAYRPLRAAGIDPHLTILVDGSVLIARQFEDVSTDAGWLVVPPQIHPTVIERFRGRLVSWQSGALPEFRDWLTGPGASAGDILGTGGTVTYSAIDAAHYLGCPEIYTFGLDLAFQDDGQTHAGNSMYTERLASRAGLIPVPGNVRPQVWTVSQFATYIELLAGLAASLAQKPNRRLVNVNPDGARIPNLEHCLPAAIDPARFPRKPALAERLAERCTGGGMTGQDLLGLLDRTVADLDILDRQARNAVALCRQLATPGAQLDRRTGSRLRRLQKAEARLGESSPGGLLLSTAVRASSMDALAFCAGIAGDDADGFARVHTKCAEYYTDLEKMVQWLREELTDARARIESN